MSNCDHKTIELRGGNFYCTDCSTFLNNPTVMRAFNKMKAFAHWVTIERDKLRKELLEVK